MDSRRHRRLLVLLGAAFVTIVVVVMVAYPSGEPGGLPAPLEGVTPVPGEAVVGQMAVTVDMLDGYEISLVVDGVPIPPSEIHSVVSLGTFRWQPGPGSVIAGWEPGEHTIEVSWDRIAGRQPDPGAFSWRFRVT